MHIQVMGCLLRHFAIFILQWPLDILPRAFVPCFLFPVSQTRSEDAAAVSRSEAASGSCFLSPVSCSFPCTHANPCYNHSYPYSEGERLPDEPRLFLQRNFAMNGTKKSRNLSALMLIAALAFAGQARAEDKATIGDHMDTINSAVKKLRRDVKVADKNKDSIDTAKGAAEAAAKCVEMEPDIARKVPAAEKEKFIAEYRKQMKELAATFTDMAKLLGENKNEEAEKLVAKLLDQKKKGHDQFTE